jgi:hypothetical protein
MLFSLCVQSPLTAGINFSSDFPENRSLGLRSRKLQSFLSPNANKISYWIQLWRKLCLFSPKYKVTWPQACGAVSGSCQWTPRTMGTAENSFFQEASPADFSPRLSCHVVNFLI